MKRASRAAAPVGRGPQAQKPPSVTPVQLLAALVHREGRIRLSPAELEAARKARAEIDVKVDEAGSVVLESVGGEQLERRDLLAVPARHLQPVRDPRRR